MDSSQLLKGVLDIAVLAALQHGDDYGYALVTTLREAGFDSVGEASVYGTLRRLNKDGAVSTYTQPSENGPNRKYYSLTERGAERFQEGAKSWQLFTETMNYLVKEGSR